MVAGRARIIVMLHPEDEEGAAQRKVAAMTGIEALGGGAKVSHSLCHPCNICKCRYSVAFGKHNNVHAFRLMMS